MSKRQRLVARKLKLPLIALVMMTSMMALAGGGPTHAPATVTVPAP